MRATWWMGMGSVVGVLSGCAAEPVTSNAPAELGSGTECEMLRCGSNSPVIDGLGFHELNLQSAENAQHMRLVGFMQGNTEYTLHVTQGRLWGSRDGQILEHAELVGSRLLVSQASGTQVAITIADVGAAHFWAVPPGMAPESVPTIETYDLQWADSGADGVGDPWTPVCGAPADDGRSMGMAAATAVVFEGDRIDAQRKTVSSVIDPAWFNIGCVGHALAKLALTGHTEAARSFGYETTPAERQAMLKMLTGDYCGTGEAFTVPGQPLYWRDDRGWMGAPSYPGPVHTPVEARWGAGGAICLGAPRLDVNPPASWPATLPPPPPSLKARITGACPALPACMNLDPGELDGAHLVSANPL